MTPQMNRQAQQELPETALTITGLTCGYPSDQGENNKQGAPILNDLDLTVNKGEIVCLLGASGCGKTTLLKAIAGLLPLSSGKMNLNQTVIDDGLNWLPPELRNIGLIFQDYALFPHLTVEKNIAFGLQGKSQSEKKVIVDDMLDLVHLSGLAERYPHQLSGGQQQRVAIARSLAYQPDLLLLDEPFSNIDTQVRHELIRDIRTIFKKQGVTAIFVTHSREEAFAFADKMAVMNAGIIEQFGTPTALYYQPSSRFVADFLGGGCYVPARKVTQESYETVLGTLTINASSGNVEKGNDEKDNGITVGELCEILLRPQQIGLLADENSQIAVAEQQFMGEHCRYVVEVDGVRLLAESNYHLVVGQRVSLNVNTVSALVFAI